MNAQLWIVGREIMKDGIELGWMLEGIFETEELAKQNANEGEFIALAKLNSKLPKYAKDVEKLYWPHLKAE